MSSCPNLQNQYYIRQYCSDDSQHPKPSYDYLARHLLTQTVSPPKPTKTEPGIKIEPMIKNEFPQQNEMEHARTDEFEPVKIEPSDEFAITPPQ